MWLLTDAADWFDHRVEEGEEFFDELGTHYARDFEHDTNNWNSFKLQAVAWGYAGYKLSTTVASGYVDTLRIGDGIKKGGWGYAHDALRALVVVGPALRAARALAGASRRVEVARDLGICAWVASAQALRLTGTKLFARVSDIARKAGKILPTSGPATQALKAKAVAKVVKTKKTIHATTKTGKTGKAIAGSDPRVIGEIEDLRDIFVLLRQLGSRLRFWGSNSKPAFQSMEEIMTTAGRNPDGLVLFGVEWFSQLAGEFVGHALIARRTVLGVRIFDRSGKVVRSLAQLDEIYPGIKNARPSGAAAVIDDAVHVTALENFSATMAPLNSILDEIAIRVAPVKLHPVPKKPEDPAAHTMSQYTASGVKPRGTARSRHSGGGSSSAKGRSSGPARGGTGSKSHPDSSPTTPRRFHQKPTCGADRTNCGIAHYYITREGDTLADIAQDAYGRPEDWAFIHSANVGRLGQSFTGSQSLKPGLTLTIPTFH